ncbi:hypothetical protein O1611_g7806 [Lasiodiplodia mahajangana]|uniref:Uncharacterized protein n=1 Tax=Lasiodiplodia mahajangana TaxID=1108764 RepID=A0ACC2JEU7_9PEZI|nr:hypothetical protein O1611_g7806 [Lasiodiplodia mahajangana]
MDQPTEIYDGVIDCLHLLVKLTGQAYDDSGSAAELRWKNISKRPPKAQNIQTLQQSFYFWLSCTDAVADDFEDTLDARLMNDWRTKAMVIGLLHAILKSLERLFASIHMRQKTSKRFFEAVSTHHSDVEPLRTVEKAIDNLFALRVDKCPPIQQPSETSPDHQAPPVAPLTAEDFHFEQNIIKLLRRKYPSARETLLRQLSTSITYRKRRISQKLQNFKDTEHGGGKGEEDAERAVVDPQQQILQELEPYICLSEECRGPIRYFRLFRDWVNHMDSTHLANWPSLIHTSSWSCDIEHPYKEIFQDEESFETHMYDSLLHPRGGRPSYRQLSALSREKKTEILRDSFVCPLCEVIPEEVLRIGDRTGFSDSSRTWFSLYEHISDHLLSLSYLSHPLLYSEDNASDETGTDNLTSPSKASLDNNISEASLYSLTLSNLSSHLPNLDESDKGRPPSIHAEDEGLRSQDDKIPDIVNTEELASLRSIWSNKLKDIDDNMLSYFQKRRDHAACVDLRTRIAKAHVDNAMDHRQFVPITSINELFTPEAIQTELSKCGMNSNHLFEYVLQKCQKTFLILIYIKRIALIEDLVKEGFSDLSLPVTLREHDHGNATVICPERDSSKVLNTWSHIEANDFYEAQWAFLAPVFSEDTFIYNIHDKCPLPFVWIDRKSERKSAFSIVRKVTVSPGHMNFTSLENIQTIAVKQLSPDHARPEREAEVQRLIHELKHGHLLKCLATFKINGIQMLMFPWAQGGNLRDTWQKLDNLHIRNETLVPWVLHQLCGLSSALNCLHSHLWCHGDLKPENILRFPAHDDPGILVIADMGLATFHDKSTQEGVNRTSATLGTIRYEHPEGIIDPLKAVSRSADVWSFGCVAMEFIIWLLYGYEELKDFEGQAASFFCTIQKRAEINPITTRWSDHMMRDPRCEPGTALRDLLELIRKRLLVFEKPTTGLNDEGSGSTTTNPPPHSTKVDPVPQFVIEQTDLSRAPMQGHGEAVVAHGRADSRELCERLSAIARKSSLEGEVQGRPWSEMARPAGPIDRTALPWSLMSEEFIDWYSNRSL